MLIENGNTYCGHDGDMPGYVAYLGLNITQGYGVTLLESTLHSPMISIHTLDFFGAILSGEELPDTKPIPDLVHLEGQTINDYVGNYWQVSGNSTTAPEAFDIKAVANTL